MAQPVDGGAGKQSVCGEGLIPFFEVEVAGHQGGNALVALCDQVVEVLVGGSAKRRWKCPYTGRSPAWPRRFWSGLRSG